MSDERSWRRRLDDAAGSPMARDAVKFQLAGAVFMCGIFAVGLVADGHVLFGLLVAAIGGLAALGFALLLRKGFEERRARRDRP